MQEKYYTPSIEDIRVGYECESHEWCSDELGISELNYDRWVRTTLNNSRVETIVKYGIKGIRVPYLTKEQIESEEWKHKRLNLFIKEKKDIKYSLYLLEGEKVMISRESPNFHILYTGECPSINEFRYITNKLLKIQ